MSQKCTMALAELDGLDGLSLVASLASARSAAACVSQTRQKFKFICVTCKKSFKYNSDLKRHERVHTGEKPFKCDMCSKSYQQKSALGTHRLVQHGADPYVCARCRCGFRDKQTLRTHELEHTGPNPYMCDLCDQDLQGVLPSVHMLTHSGQKYFTCNICDRSFAAKARLIEHTTLAHNVSTQKDSYPCDQCSRVFTSLTTLQNHKDNHSRVKVFKCAFCDDEFDNIKSLRQHEPIHRAEEIPSKKARSLTPIYPKLKKQSGQVQRQIQIVTSIPVASNSMPLTTMQILTPILSKNLSEFLHSKHPH